MQNSPDDFWNDIFHSCAAAAYADIAAEQRTSTPDSEAVRRLAYKYYEGEKNAHK